jgi:integrase
MMPSTSKPRRIERGRRTLARNIKTIESTKPESRRTAYTIRGERGLRLVVHSTGRKVWFSVYQLGSGASLKRKWREIGLFSTHENGWTLAKACEENRRVQGQVSKGVNPESAQTFSELFGAWLEDHAKKKLARWRDEEARYHLHLEKPLGAKRLEEIERKDIREVRDVVLERAGPIQSNRTVALFNRVMNWAVNEDRAKYNPAAQLKKVGEEKRRERVATNDELAGLWAELGRPLSVDHTEGGLTEADLKAAVAVRRAIKLLIATGQRRGEVIGMMKSELDLSNDEAWWTLPGGRTKNRLPHRVFLTKTAVEILHKAIEASGESEFVFPSVKAKGSIRPDAVTKQLQRMCKKISPRIRGIGPHDLRRTIGTTMRKLGISVEDRSHVFNHVSGAKAKVTSWNYDAGEHDDEKRRALEKWDSALRQIVGLDSPPSVGGVNARVDGGT